MTGTIHNTILPMTDTTAEPEDYLSLIHILQKRSVQFSIKVPA